MKLVYSPRLWLGAWSATQVAAPQIFPAERKSLQQAEHNQRDRRRDPDRGIARQEPDAEGRHAHQAHGDEGGSLAPDDVANASE